MKEILKIIFWVAVLALTYVVGALIAKAIWGTNLPDWLKVYLISL